jgi:hypothetical protein
MILAAVAILGATYDEVHFRLHGSETLIPSPTVFSKRAIRGENFMALSESQR